MLGASLENHVPLMRRKVLKAGPFRAECDGERTIWTGAFMEPILGPSTLAKLVLALLAASTPSQRPSRCKG